jgi:hypothetical protein
MERMPTDAEIAQYIAAIFGFQPGNNPQQRLNYLQDWSKSVGFDPLGQPFQPEPFPELEFAPITREIYATDPGSPYVSIFDAMDQGIDPVNAARAAINNGAFGDPNQLDEDFRRDVVRTAREYGTELRNFRSEQAKWERQQAKAAAEAPISLQELLFPPSERDVASAAYNRPEGLTIQDLARIYAENRKALSRTPPPLKPSETKRAAAGGRSGAPGPTMSLYPTGVSGMAPYPGQVLPEKPQKPLGSQEGGKSVGQVQKPVESYLPGAGAPGKWKQRQREGFDAAAKSVLEVLGQRAVRTPRQQDVIRNIAYMNLISGGM